MNRESAVTTVNQGVNPLVIEDCVSGDGYDVLHRIQSNRKLNQDCAYLERGHNQFHALFVQREHAIENGYFVVSKRFFSLTMELKERSELRFLCTHVSLDPVLYRSEISCLVCMLIVSAKYPVEELCDRPGNRC